MNQEVTALSRRLKVKGYDRAITRTGRDGFVEAVGVQPGDMDCAAAAKLIERANAVCEEYESDGFGDPGRAMDAIRDILGRRV